MTEHNIHTEPQPIADQWMLSCSCGWRAKQPLYYYIGPGARLVASAARHQMIADHLLSAGREAGGVGPIDVTQFLKSGDQFNAYFEMTEELPNACTVFANLRAADGSTLEVARGEPTVLTITTKPNGVVFRYSVPVVDRGAQRR